MGRKKAASDLPLADQTFVFGTFLADLTIEATRRAIEQFGGSVSDSLSSTTTFLVLDRLQPNKKTKLEKDADKLNARGATIRVLDRSAFLNLVGIVPPAPATEPAATKGTGKKASPAMVQKKLLTLLLGGPTGVQKWNDLSPDERRAAGSFGKADLSKGHLREANLATLDFRNANFDGASLIEARLDYADFQFASFLNANLRGADLRESKFANARFDGANLKEASLRVGNFRCVSFRNADLTGADLCYDDLCGADFEGATLTETAFEKASYDATTRWPHGFAPSPEMRRIETHDEVRVAVKPLPAGQIDIATFVGRVESKLNKSEGGRKVMEKVRDMLKKEKFRLFAEVTPENVAGVVKSQFNADPQAVYSCRLTSEGEYDCYSPKLPVCGGMKYGGPCKHLLVLVIGLVRAAQIDATTADWWLSQTKKRSYSTSGRRKADQEEKLFETLLKFKGAEAGQVDWRPTETVPEDYYAL